MRIAILGLAAVQQFNAWNYYCQRRRELLSKRRINLRMRPMKDNILEYTREEISQLPDDRLDQAWKGFMRFAGQRQRLREQVQRMLRKKSPTQSVKAKDVPEGGIAVTKAGEREVLLARVQGQVYAIDNACGHSGYPLDQGKLDGYVVTCRWHDAKFDVRSGAVLAPGRDMPPIKRFRVAEVNGAMTIGDQL